MIQMHQFLVYDLKYLDTMYDPVTKEILDEKYNGLIDYFENGEMFGVQIVLPEKQLPQETV